MWLALSLPGGEAWAFFTELHYHSEEFGRREVLTFNLPPGDVPPRLTLLSPTTLRMTIPNLLALPLPDLRKAQARFIKGFSVEEIPGGAMGLHVTMELSEPYLDFRGFVRDGQYQLEIERYPIPSAVGPTRLLEGLSLPGRDGTLLVISYTGHGWVEEMVDYGARVVRLQWQGGSLDQGWRPVVSQGLVDAVNVYGFSRNQVEMEVKFLPQVTSVHFTRNSQAGTLVLEFRAKGMVGREQEVAEMITRRKTELEAGHPQPLNRLTPVFVNSADKVLLAGQAVDAAYFWNRAKEEERDHNYARARAYLDALRRFFPNTVDPEVIDFYKVELASKMNWQSGWLLNEVESALAHHPNSHRYPEFRLLQLKTYNRGSLFENAAAIIWDPNLPKNDPRVALERGRTFIGLRRWDEALESFQEVFRLDGENGDPSAEAAYLLAHLELARGDNAKANAILDGLSHVHMVRIANHPRWLMEVGDIYFHNQAYEKALQKYAQFMENYPKHPELAPWVLLHAAESRRHLGQREDALHLYQQLLLEHPESEAATWGRIFRLQLDKDRDLDDRLHDLESIIVNAPLTGAIVEAVLHKAMLQGDAGRHRESLETLNGLLTLTSRDAAVARANHLKGVYLVAGMEQALERRGPEYAVLLAELFGDDWRFKPGFEQARVQLGEALLRMGIPEQALPLLKMERERNPRAQELYALGDAFVRGTQLGVDRGTDRISPRGARVRLAEAVRLAKRSQWEGILLLLDHLPEELLNTEEKAERLRLLAKAEAGRGRFPQAVSNLEKLLYGKPLGDGMDYYWYATLLQLWQGDAKSLEAFRRVAREAENKEVQALARMRIGDILQRAGQLDQAQAAYRQANENLPGSSVATVAQEIVLQLEMSK